MKYIIIKILLLSASFITAQVPYVLPTENGDVECVLLTKETYDKIIAACNINTIESEIDELIEIAPSGEWISGNYNKSNGNKNGFSLIQIARNERIDVSTSGKKIDIAKRIFAKIEEIRNK